MQSPIDINKSIIQIKTAQWTISEKFLSKQQIKRHNKILQRIAKINVKEFQCRALKKQDSKIMYFQTIFTKSSNIKKWYEMLNDMNNMVVGIMNYHCAL